MPTQWLGLISCFLLMQTTVAAPIIWWVSPRVGSIVGGTLLNIQGSEFAVDAFTSSNIVWLEGEGTRVICDVISYTAAPYRIECRTRPHPNATAGESYAVLQTAVATDSGHYVSYRYSRSFTYYWHYTPRVEWVLPSSGPAGSLIEIAGYNLRNDADYYERLYLGDLQCNHINSSTNQPYGIRWYFVKRHIKCLVEKEEAGVYNASLVDGRGASWNDSQAMYLMYDGSLAMYELYPDIHSVSPHIGSTQGGTLITVVGSSFGTNVFDIEVDVDGTPCHVMTHNMTHITCWSGRPNDNDLSVADADGSYSVTANGHRFRGSRGVSFKHFHGSIYNLDTLHLHSNYPDNPDTYGVYPSYSSEYSNNKNRFGERLEAFFNPQSTGNHTFFVAADDQAEVLLGQGTNISNLNMVAYSHRAVPWHGYYVSESQRSDMMQLEEGEDYLLVADFAEGYGYEYINVAVLMHETQYTYSQTQQANREKQVITFSTAGVYETQKLTVIINASAVSTQDNGEEEEGILLQWGSDRKVIVTAVDLLNNPNDTVAMALYSLFWGQCSYTTQHGIFYIQFWNNAVYSFESNETHSDDISLWLEWNGDAPVVVQNMSLCGRSSLYLRQGRVRMFDLEANSNLAIELEDYPYYMCFAYKIPKDYPFALMFRLRDVGYWLSAYFIRDVEFSNDFEMGKISNLDVGAHIQDDDRWHYTCIDLQAIIANGFPEYSGVHYVEGFGFYSNADPQSPGFYLDEVSFSHFPRTLDTTNYMPPVHPNGIILKNITATNHTVAMDDGLVAVTVNLEFNPLDCEYNFTLISAELTHVLESVIHEVTVERVQEASQPLGGSFILRVKGKSYDGETTPLPYDASVDEIKYALESVQGIGKITVTEWPFLGIDRYQTGCPGRLIYVEFEDLAGDQLMITVEGGGLSGDNVHVTVGEVLPGGMMAHPIPGHMLQTVERTPQVHVRVKGQLAGCSGGHSLYHEFEANPDEDTDFCRFSYSPTSTPHIITVTPPTATHGDTVTITGSGFGTDSSLILILFGDVPCVVDTAADVEVTCTLGEGVAGHKKVFLQVAGNSGGIALIDDTVDMLQYSVVVESVSPSEGSQAGGTEITISGAGFAPTSSVTVWEPENSILLDAYKRAKVAQDNGCPEGWETIVTVGMEECDIITSDHVTITCITPANQNAGTTDPYDTVVTVRCKDGSQVSSHTLSDGFAYSDTLTPEITGITPAQGSVYGGNSITITGTEFSEDPTSISVMLGGATCSVTYTTLTMITCTSPTNSGGTFPVKVLVAGKGFAEGVVEYMFVFTVTSLSHCSGSLLGGQLLDISGEGFGTDRSRIEVLLGDHPCSVNEISNTLIRCVTSPATTTHVIDNNNVNTEYGLGYAWKPDEITITVGDTILWKWYGTSFTRQLSVQQIDQPGDTEYNGDGFISSSSTSGSFSQVFTETGDYYYIAGGYGHIGFNGTIHVVPLTDIEATLTLKVDSLPIEVPPSIVCGALSENFDHYTYAATQTPHVSGTSSPIFSYLNENTVMISGLATTPEHNLFTIGGKACLSSGKFSSLVKPAHSGPADDSVSYTNMEESVDCELDSVEPGVYRPILHVAGKGYGLVTDDAIVKVVPSYGPAHLHGSRGSLRGGTLLEINVRGLSEDDITKTRVEIGNTPCHVQRIDPVARKIYCITQPARDDGYSSLVHELDPIAYWSLQADYYDLEGAFIDSDGEVKYRNTGTLGSSSDAIVRGDVIGREAGISGSMLTNQAALFNKSYVEVPFHSEFARPTGFGMELWLKMPSNIDYGISGSGLLSDPLTSGYSGISQSDSQSGSGDPLWDSTIPQDHSGSYHIVVDFASFSNGVAHGYVIVINPCGQPEFWLASRQSINTFTDSEDCPLLTSSQCSSSPPTACSGYSVAVMATAYGNLPPGVWSIIRCGNCDVTEWSLLSFGWEADNLELADVDCASLDLCSGKQVFYFNDIFIDTVPIPYSPGTNRSLVFGGTDRLPLGELSDSQTSFSTGFVGHLDEISVYSHPMSSEKAHEHYEYGSTEKQKVWIRVDSMDGITMGSFALEWNGAFEQVEYLNWNVARGQMELSNNTALVFTWTGLKGIWQVSKATYESCDITDEPIRVWSPPQMGGETVVWLDSGQTSYFIDSVAGNCINGSKLMVKVGNIREITWQIDQTYEEITIPVGEGLLFKWSGANYHNLIEMASPQSTSSQCTFVDISTGSGQVVKAWQDSATTSGEVVVSGLSPGNHYFVCSIGNHCQRGMRVNVTVTTNDQQEGNNEVESPVEHTVSWKIQEYDPLIVRQGETVTFSWEGFHSLHQVDKETYEMCDVVKDPLFIWADPSVDTTVSITNLQPGTYYFLCSIAGHCSAGMKITTIVLPKDGQPTLLNPTVGLCHSLQGCSFVYAEDDTPYVTSVMPSVGTVGTELTVSGYGLVPHGYHNGQLLPTVTVWVGHSPCSNVMVVSTNVIEVLSCTVRHYEAGYHFVDVMNDKGLAAVFPSPLTPGPHRNSSEPQDMDSSYPYFSLRPTVTDVSPETGSIAGGTLVTIVGSGFSPVADRMNVLLGDRSCTIRSSTYSVITCVSSGGVGEGGEVVVTVNEYEAQSTAQFTFSSAATPTISSIIPQTDIAGGDDIVISGTNFGSVPSSVSVLILSSIEEWQYDSMESPCNVSAVVDTSITCSLPVKPAGSYAVAVHVAGLGLAESSFTVQYALTFDSFSPIQAGNGGGIEIVITGTGFPETSNIDTESDDTALSVWFCSTKCGISSSSLTQLVCILDAPSVDDANTVCGNVQVSYSRMTASATDTFQFSSELTPQITDISPLIGGTAGGTIVTILGSKFYPPEATEVTEDDIIVTIDGAICEWVGQNLPPNDSFIQCRTSDHKTTLLAEVKVFIRDRGFALPSTPDTKIQYQYIDRWSSQYTWGGEGLPKEGDSVVIQQGQIIFLDIDTPVLNLVLVEGELVFEDKQDLHLQAKYIFINTGKLQVGTEESPFLHRARITLHGTVQDPEIPIYGAKVLGVRQGDLDLHGRPRLRTWTRLAETAPFNSTLLVLQEPVDWAEGDKIVIASTSKDGNETEENEIISVSANGLTLSLAHHLRYEHLGVTEVFEGGQFIEMRAEVGLLSHNVIVEGSRLGILEGDGGLGEDQYGVQIMVHRIGPYPTPIRIEHTEVRYAGQAFRLGRYAIHFHLTGTMNGSYVRNCAIHHSNNRALTAHGVHDLLIEGNVAYDIKGHTFFVEDGIETNNHYIRNLGILTRGSSSLLNTDQLPATFWITHPGNTFIGNAAVASRAYGFWYDLDRFPSGASYTTRVCPNKEPFGQFIDNTAHTCNEFGLRIWESYTPYEGGCHEGLPLNVTLYNFTTYNNGIHGVEFSVIGHVSIENFKIADNVNNGFEIQEALGEWGGAVIKNSLIVGHTSYNHGNPQQGGIKTINKGNFTVSNVVFVNFDLSGSSCLRACSQCKFREGGFQVWFEGLEFYNSPNKAFFQWEHEVLYRDLDGSLTGHPGGGWVLPNSPLLPPTHCLMSVPDFSLNPTVGGATCTSNVYFLRLAWNNAQPLETLLGVSVNVTNEFGTSVVPWRHYRRTHGRGYMCTLPSAYPYSLTWNLTPEHNVDTTFYSAGVYNVRPVDHITVTHHFIQAPDHVNIGGNYEPTDSGDLPEYGVDSHLSWHIGNDSNQTVYNVTYLISGENSPSSYGNLLYTYQYEPCPRDGCIEITPDIGKKEVRYWSNNSSWTNGQPPREGDDVTILSQWLMIVDVTPPPLGRVFVHGELQFENGRDYNFTANIILIHGPGSGMTIGTAESPFLNRVTITLTGRRRDIPLVLTRGLILGSKAIGVFGNVSMHGAPRTVTWTHLSLSASAGSTTITVVDTTEWKVGDQIVIAPSGWGVEEGEVRTIVAISGSEITIDEPLLYNHIIYDFLDPSDLDNPQPEGLSPVSQWWNDGEKVAPEVGLLSHNIIIQGGEDENEPLEHNHYGCRLLVGRYQVGTLTYGGHLQMQSVEFRYCGQGGYFSPRDPRYSIAFRSSRDTSAGSYIRDCSIHHGYNTAIGVHLSNGVTLSGNVVWRTTDSAFKIGGVNNKALDNLAIYTTTVLPNNPPDNHAVDFPASFEVNAGNVVRGNAAAGSTRLGFSFAGEPCREDGKPPSSEQATFWGNTAHTGLAGLVVLGLNSDCTAASYFTATYQWNYGVFSSTASSLVMSHLRLAVGKVGMNLNVFGPDPVQHFIGGKSISVTDSILIASLPDQSCSTELPDWAPQESFIAAFHIGAGVMMSSFNERRSKMDGTAAWHLMKGYPVIDGVLRLTNITFARFSALSNPCPYGIYAITNNPLSPDAVHPIVMTGTTHLNCDENSLVHFHDPDPDWINQEDCIDMDCDGPKHALIVDSDGAFVGSYPIKGTVAPFAELRFSNYRHRLPESWLANTDFGIRASPDQVLEDRSKGVARGEFNVDCQWREAWNAYACKSLDHRMLVIESMDADSETRRLSPLALDGGDTGHGSYTDLLNGPMDHGWCTYYTCLKRLSTFFTIVAMGTYYHVWMTGSNPLSLRFHVLNAAPNEAIRLNIWYKNPQRKDVYKNGVFIEAENTEFLNGKAVREKEGEEFIPAFDTSYSGANYFNRDTKIMHLLIRGSDPVEIRTAPVVQVSLNLDVSLDDFFDPNDLIDRLAFVLNIDRSTIRIVKIVAEDSLPFRKRRQVGSATQTTTTVTLEFGDPPEVNISQPTAPSVAEEIQMSGEVNDSVDIENVNEFTNQTLSENPLNEDPPQSFTEYIAGLNASVTEYTQMVEVYLQQANSTTASNMLGEAVLNAILTNSLVIENVTITGVTVVPAPPPAPPSPPVIPPLYENITSNGGGDNVTEDLVIVLNDVLEVLEETEMVAMENTPETLVEGESDYVIPDNMRITMEPKEETGHLVHVKLTIFDASGEPVKNLGLVNPWMCKASLVHSNRQPHNEQAQLEGVISVPFVDGIAEFTRLRVDRIAEKLTLSFTTVPARFQTNSSVQFSVVGLPDNVEGKQVSFLLSQANDGNSVDWGSKAVQIAIARQVGMALDVDLSRIQNVTLQEVEWGDETVVYVQFTLLAGHPSDPHDVPSLSEAHQNLQTLVQNGDLILEVEGVSLSAVPESFNITPSPPPTISTGTEGGISEGSFILILLGAGGSATVILSILIMCFMCCKACCRGTGNPKLNKGARTSTRNSFSQLPRLRSVVKVNPLAEDSSESSDDDYEVVPSFRPMSKLPIPPPSMPASADLWDYDQDDDTDSSSINTRDNMGYDCWTAPMYATPTASYSAHARVGSNSNRHGKQPTTLGLLANPPSNYQSRNPAPSPPASTSHLTYVQPANRPKDHGYRM